jgi:hypothetical protein
MTEIKEAAMPSNDYWTQIMGATPTNQPTTSPSLPTSPVADVRREQQTLGSGTNGQTNSYGNDMTLANQMNAQAAKMRQVNAPTSALPTPGSSGSVPSAPSYNPFSRPTDGAGDAAGRASQYDNLIREAADSRGLTKGQRAAKIQAAQAMLTPGLAQMQQQGRDYAQQMQQQGRDYAQQMNALNAGSLPAMFGSQNSGISPDVMKGLFSMFQTNPTPAVP